MSQVRGTISFSVMTAENIIAVREAKAKVKIQQEWQSEEMSPSHFTQNRGIAWNNGS